jgi:acyl-CoA synthetase (AMP-forming)/AMP-acid ligase II
MISRLLDDYSKSAPERPFLIDGSGEITAADAFARVETLVQMLQAMRVQRLFFYCRDSADLVLANLASEAAGLQCCVINRQATSSEVDAILQRLGHGALITDCTSQLGQANVFPISHLARARPKPGVSSAPAAKPGTIVVLTTGTTGPPKAALYAWDRLLGRLPSRDGAHGKVWLLAYPLNHFAGLQVLLGALRDRSTLVIPQARDFGSILGALTRYHVTCVSATPTFWRMLVGRLNAEQAAQLRIEQITLGGEASTAELLTQLRSRFPSATITQIYATTEAGSCFAVKDGQPGFPASYLDRPVGNVELKIVGEELYVRSAVAMSGYLDNSSPSPLEGEWIKTGDLVEQSGDRVLFLGRKSEVINVGGVKVHPL